MVLYLWDYDERDGHVGRDTLFCSIFWVFQWCWTITSCQLWQRASQIFTFIFLHFLLKILSVWFTRLHSHHQVRLNRVCRLLRFFELLTHWLVIKSLDKGGFSLFFLLLFFDLTHFILKLLLIIFILSLAYFGSRESPVIYQWWSPLLRHSPQHLIHIWLLLQFISTLINCNRFLSSF